MAAKSVLMTVLMQATVLADFASTAASAGDVYKGVFAESFEMSAFEPCNSDERWWLDARGDANKPFWTRIRELRVEFETENDVKLSDWATPFYYLEASGNLSERGEHGHMGEYDRQFDLTDFFVFRLATSEEQRLCLTSEFFRNANRE